MIEDQKQSHLNGAIEVLLAEDTKKLLAKIILDSLRADPSDFLDEEGVAQASSIESFCEKVLTTNMIVPMLTGVGKANAEVFGPLKKMFDINKLTTSLAERVEKLQETPKEEPEPEEQLH